MYICSSEPLTLVLTNIFFKIMSLVGFNAILLTGQATKIYSLRGNKDQRTTGDILGVFSIDFNKQCAMAIVSIRSVYHQEKTCKYKIENATPDVKTCPCPRRH